MKHMTYQEALPGGQTRLRELILYIAGKCAKAESFGLTKLNKILWRADFEAFAERGTPVTGRAYQRLQFGPAPVEMMPLLREMQGRGLIAIEQRETGGSFTEQRVRASGKPSLHFFSDDDIEYIDRSISYYWEKTATGASEDSHGIAWRLLEDGDAMPYDFAYLSDAPINERQLEGLRAIAQEEGWRTQ